MDQVLVAHIAREVIEGAIFYNWKFYVVFLALAFLIWSAISFIGPYLKGRAGSLATKADFDELLDQSKKLTEMTEKIRQDISYTDWQKRESFQTRRMKLEELMLSVNDCRVHLDAHESAALFEQEMPVGKPFLRLQTIGALYFPEMDCELAVLGLAFDTYTAWLLKARMELLPLVGDEKRAKLKALTEDLLPTVHRPMLEAVMYIEYAGRGIMYKMLGVTDPYPEVTEDFAAKARARRLEYLQKEAEDHVLVDVQASAASGATAAPVIPMQ